MWITRRTLPAVSSSTIVASSSGVAPSPISRLFISTMRMTAMTASRIPIISVPIPSHTGSPVIVARPTPNSAKTRPSKAPASSSNTTGSSGVRDWRMKPHHVTEPLILLDSPIAVMKLNVSSPIATRATRSITSERVVHSPSQLGEGQVEPDPLRAPDARLEQRPRRGGQLFSRQRVGRPCPARERGLRRLVAAPRWHGPGWGGRRPDRSCDRQQDGDPGVRRGSGRQSPGARLCYGPGTG